MLEPEKLISVSSGKLFCSTCRKELFEAENHVKSAKHAQRKKRVASSKSREREIADALKVYEQEAHPVQWLDASRGSQAVPCEGIDLSYIQTFKLTIIYSVDDCLLILGKF